MPRLNLKVSHAVALMVFSCVAVTAALLIAVVAWMLDDDAAQNAINRQNVAIRATAIALAKAVPGSRIDWSGNTVSRIVLPRLPEPGDHGLIDDVSRISGGTATVFAYDAGKDDFVRLSTSVKKADGTRAVGTVLGRQSAAYPAMKAGTIYRGEATILDVPYYTVYLPVFDPSGSVIGVVYGGVKQDEVDARLNSLLRTIIGLSIVLTLLLAGVAVLLASRLLRPIGQLAGVMERLAQDDLSVEIPHRDKKNEFGVMAHTIQVFRDHADERRVLQAEQERQTARRLARQEEVDAIIAAFRTRMSRMVDAVRLNTGELLDVAGSLSQVAARTTARTVEADRASQEASNSVQGVAGATEELSASIGEITSQVSRASTVVADATRGAQSTGSKVRELSEGAERIGKVVELIQAIAAQTNLLALNATIEAARAGEMGKGFAVVAQEVKELAAQTGKATEEIGHQIQSIQGATADVVQAIEQIVVTIGDVDRYTSAIASAVTQQNAATGEITRNIVAASQGSATVASNITHVMQAVNETDTCAGRVTDATRRLADDNAQLNAALEDFLARVATA
ncbi:methyl-accepting chemotaxis protein [Azorhizobium caulinodans]|uniref:methyl-accepting chemotaxis protein n=1 Tax=Azorhizobium caulinodans TaxID=7 RepID=UPI002FBDAB85